MFAKTIVLSDAFLDLPMSARCLYFTLGMLADDDGFVNAPRSIMRQCGASDDDMKLLIAKKFVLIFDSGVIVIKHWRINNYLRNDRYTETKYVDEKAQLTVDGKGGYHRNAFCAGTPIEQIETIGEDNRTVRKQAYEDSDLPNNFDNKIREAFYGKPCPICGTKMQRYRDECGVISETRMPTIQHNTPISKGGKHELSNISVICHSCNVTIKDKPTGPLNNSEVVEEWQKISGIPNSGIHSKEKDSIDKISLDQERIGEERGTGETHSVLPDKWTEEYKESLRERARRAFHGE